MKKDSRPDEASSGLNSHRGRTIPVAMLLILVVLLSASSGIYAGASYFAPQAPGVTVTTTIFTTTTSWSTSTIWSTVTSVVQGVLTTIEYTTSTSTVTITGSTSYRTAKTVTAHGNAQISTAQSKFGGASGLFHGSGDYLTTASSTDFEFPGDFTIDFQWRFNSPLPNDQYALDKNGVRNGFAIDYYGGHLYYLYGGSVVISPSWSPSTGTWYHIALVRSGTTVKLYVDGVSIGSGTQSGTLNSGGIPLIIGRNGDGAYGGGYVFGWIDELHVSKGVARWTSNFTPPTSAYTGDSNTVLLLHMDGADGSTTFIDSP